jgi:hypothetical protein
MKTMKQLIAGLVTLVLVAPLWAADSSVRDHPGYVDFSTLTNQAETEPTVEISLRAPILNMVTNLIRAEDEMAADFVSKLLRVSVNVFESDDIDVSEIADSMASIAADLDARGWERVVRVRESSEHVDIYMRLSDDGELIHGITIMVAEPGDTVMVNIVGDISGNDLAALGRRFDIDELAALEVEPD